MKTYSFTIKMIFFGLVMGLSALNFSCKKGKDKEPDQLSLLTAKKWKRALTDNNPDINPVVRIYHTVLPCEEDDILEWKKDGTYQHNAGVNKCEENEQQTYSIPYSVDFPTKEITIDGDKIKILELTSERLKLGVILPSPMGIMIYMYEH